MNRKQFLTEAARKINLEGYLRDTLSVQEVEEHGAELVHSCRLPTGNHKNGDSSPSASINRDTLLFNCFSCGLGGDLYWLTQQILDCSLADAMEAVENYLPDSTAVTYLEFRERLREQMDKQELMRKEWMEYDPRIIEPWKKYSQYLKERGVSAEVQVRMQTGVIEKWGDNHEQRIVIPHFFEHKLLGWTMRRGYNVNKPSSPKYVHSSHFPKRDTVYNYDNAITIGGPIVVVESPMSVLVCMSRGIENMVATFGVSTPDTQLDKLRDFEEIVVAFDGDFAGTQNAHHIVEELAPLMKVSVCDMPEGKDPADIENFQEYLYDHKVQASTFLLQYVNKRP